jgi:hypothetical protein
MKKSLCSYTAIILPLFLSCSGCGESEQSAQPRNMQLSADATHLDFSWPANEAYGLKPIAFHIPREKVDLSRIRKDKHSEGVIKKVFIDFNLRDFPKLDNAINSSSRVESLSDKKRHTYGYYLELARYPETRQDAIQRFDRNVRSNDQMIKDGIQGGLTRYTLVECFSSKQLKNNYSIIEKLQSKPAYDKTPENCFLNRQFVYLTNMNSEDSISNLVDVECMLASCYMRFSVNGRAVLIDMSRRNLDFSYEIANAAKSQLNKYIVNREQ